MPVMLKNINLGNVDDLPTLVFNLFGFGFLRSSLDQKTSTAFRICKKIKLNSIVKRKTYCIVVTVLVTSLNYFYKW